MSMLPYSISVLILSFSLLVHAENTAFLSVPIGFAKVREKVESFGFPPMASPMKLLKGEPPVFTKKGQSDISDLKLTYTRDELKMVPQEWVFELTPEEWTSALNLLSGIADTTTTVIKEIVTDPNSVLRLKFIGIEAHKLDDFQFIRPLGGKKGAIKEWQLAFTILIAEELSLEVIALGQDPVTALKVSNLLLGGEYRQMKVRTKKKKFEFNEIQRVMRASMKPKNPRYKRVDLGLPRPESGEDPTVLVATVRREQLRYEFVPMSMDGKSIRPSKRQPRDWAFRNEKGAVLKELILSSQFDGREALGVFLRILEHKKEPFHPRSRKAKLEMILVEVKFEG